ncbi:MAG: glutathione S-transferase family protein [Methylobacteriaceae bacterium]|nr:glutathione S-transferase family protein [Methylobacteriaceae bacterium]
MSTDKPILHHFDQSPFAEKIRLVFGFKQLTWNSVRVSRILPRPDLMPLTGGYRRTPVMQIGADIYCDTQIMIRELEARFPAPTLLPHGNSGLPYALAMWSDRVFFQNTVNLVFGTNADKIPQEFIEDRSQLRGARFDTAAMKAAIPQMQDQFRAHVDWIEAQLGDGRAWLLGERSLADIGAYMNIWYMRTNLTDADKMLAPFPRTLAWESRVRAIGHGTRTEISSADAIDIAAKARPQTPTQADPADANGRKPGDRVSVAPDDYGKIEVSGEIVSSSAQHIAIRRHDERAGELVVHFPRAGFVVKPS